jgi:hypothetical protein
VLTVVTHLNIFAMYLLCDGHFIDAIRMSVTASSAFSIPAGCGMSVALEGSFSHQTCGFCISQT